MTCEAWPITWPCETMGRPQALLDAARDAAQSLLWSLTGRRYGLCSTSESYRLNCSTPCGNPYGDRFGPGVDWELGGERRYCCRIHLGARPVRSIDLVEVFGDPIDPSGYTLERDTLLRLGECWPCEQTCDVAPVQVTYTWGIDVPVLGQLAMGEMACEFLAAFDGADCRLPSNAISVTRQGVSVDLGDAQTLFQMGRVGLPISDAFIRSVNPNRLQSASQVFSPDLARRAR